MKDKVILTLVAGDGVEVDAQIVEGVLAVHRAGDHWVVSHVPTGAKMGVRGTRAKALALADDFIATGIDWRTIRQDTLTDEQKHELRLLVTGGV